jgi:DNA-binding response OmpR family regulator
MAEKILIIDDDVDTLKLVGLMLQKQGYVITAASNGLQGLEQAEKENPDLILLDIMMPEIDGYQVTRRLRDNPRTSNTPILMFTAKTQLEDKVSGFEAGADDYLTKPTHPSELSAHIKALLSRTAKSRTTPIPERMDKPCFVIGVLSPRGGQGVSTVAVNLGEALRLTNRAEVIVAELRPGMGTLGPDLGEPDPKGMTEILSGKVEDVTREKVKSDIFNHQTGLHLFLGSTHPKDGKLLEASAQMEALVNQLSHLAAYLVLDLGAGLSPLVQKLIKMCNLLLVIAEPEGNAVVHTKMMVEDILGLGINKQVVKIIAVNRVRSDTRITMSQMEDQLREPPAAAITPAPELVYMAQRGKTTVMAVNPDSLTAQQFRSLALSVVESEKMK